MTAIATRAAMAVVAALAAGCDDTSICSTDVVAVAHEQGSDRYAVTQVRNCGATTGYATVVKVGRAREPQADAAEVFVADADHGAAAQDGRGAIDLRVTWTAPGRLLVVHGVGARMFKQVTRAKGATITVRLAGGMPAPART